MGERVTERWGVDPAGRAFSRESILVRGAALPASREERARLLHELDRLYYRWIPGLTGDMVSVIPQGGGGRAARVLQVGPTGLVLDAARIRDLEEGGVAVERAILSGWLVGARSGALGQELVPRAGGLEAAVHLHGFVPRLLSIPFGRALYDSTQEAIHRRLSRGFLRRDVAPLLRSLACSSSTPTRT